MKRAENTEKGLLAISLDDSGDNILRFGRMKYSGELCQFVPDCALSISDFITYMTKKDATKAAHNMGFTSHHVDRVGSRFCRVWGIRHDFRDSYFLARFE